MKCPALVLAFFIALNGSAQITPLDTVPYRLNSALTLENAGPKFIHANNTGFELYNLDLTPFLSVIYPAAPSGYHYFSYPGPYYLTESLFDNDPSTVEFMATIQDSADALVNGVRIMRTDGTILLDDLTHGMQGVSSTDSYTSSATIFNSLEGTRMELSGGGFGGGHPEESVVYALPGTLPCVPCDANMALGGGEHLASSGGGFQAFPNPAADATTIRYELPPGEQQGTIVIHDLHGAVVKRVHVNGSGTNTIGTADLAPGTYLYQLETATGVIGGQRLVVVR